MRPLNRHRFFNMVLLTTLLLGTLASAICQGNQVQDNTTVRADAIPRPQPKKFIDSYSSKHNKYKWTDLQSDLALTSLPQNDSIPSCFADGPKKNRAYLIHVVHWGKNNSVLSSSWSSYSVSSENKDANLVRRLTATGDPLIYGKTSNLFMGVNYADSATMLESLNISYKFSVVQGTARNIQDLSQLLTALLGATTGSAGKSSGPPARIAFACVSGTNHLPFSVNVAESVSPASLPSNQAPQSRQDQTPQQTIPTPASPGHAALKSSTHSPIVALIPGRFTRFAYVAYSQQRSDGVTEQPATAPQSTPPIDTATPLTTPPTESPSSTNKGGNSTTTSGLVDCTELSKAVAKTQAGGQTTSDGNCAISRTFESLDKEWWDVSLAVTVPGVRETKYSISGTSLSAKPTTHTDIYAFLDLFPSSWLPLSSPTTPIPHFIVGVPTASQSLYRPVFGISEDLTGWTGLQRHGFPLAMSFFAGAVWMKTTTVLGAPTTSAQLTAESSTERVWKPILGIELPVASLISKISKASTKSSSKSTSGSTTNGGSSTTAATP